jgi:drug/metabolite transporter (DMT)-like permease
MNSTGKLRLNGIRAAMASAVFLGLIPVFGKQAILLGFSPLAVVSLRTGIATLLLFILMLFFQRPYFYIYPVGLVGCLLAGAVNGLGSILYYSALVRIPASLGQLIYSFYPLFVAFWLLLDHQKLGKITYIRLLVSVPAIYLLLSAGNQEVDLIGALMMMGSALLYALHLIINQRVLVDVPAPTVTLYTLVSMSAVVMIAYAAFDRTMPGTDVSWVPILIMSFLTFLSRITLFMGVKHLGGMQTALLGLGELFITVFLAQWWLNESFTPVQWIGAGLLAASLMLIGVDHETSERRPSHGWLSWLHPPDIMVDIHWRSHN